MTLQLLYNQVVQPYHPYLHNYCIIVDRGKYATDQWKFWVAVNNLVTELVETKYV